MINDLEGVPVTHEEAASGLGFGSVEEMNRFYQHIDPVQQLVRDSLTRWYGPNNDQITFEIASKVTEYFLKAK